MLARQWGRDLASRVDGLKLRMLDAGESIRSHRVSSVCRFLLVLPILAFVSCEPTYVSWGPASDQVASVWCRKIDGHEVFLLYLAEIDEQSPFLGMEPSDVLDGTDGRGEFLSAPVWSPNGRYIAYYKVRPLFADSLGQDSVLDMHSLSWEHQLQKITVSQGRPKAIHSGENGPRGTDNYMSYEAELVIISPKTKQKKILKKLQWKFQGNTCRRHICRHLRPTWSQDSKRVFYSRPLLAKQYSIESVDLDGKDRREHMLSSLGIVYVSPDGRYVGTIYQKAVVMLDMATGKPKHVRLEFDGDNLNVAWANTLDKIAFPRANTIVVVSLQSGKSYYITDADVHAVETVVFSSKADQLYYIARMGPTKGRPEASVFTVRRVKLSDVGKKDLVSIPCGARPSHFCISRDSRFVLVCCVEQLSDSNKRSFVIVHDTRMAKTFKIRLDPVRKEEE